MKVFDTYPNAKNATDAIEWAEAVFWEKIDTREEKVSLKDLHEIERTNGVIVYYYKKGKNYLYVKDNLTTTSQGADETVKKTISNDLCVSFENHQKLPLAVQLLIKKTTNSQMDSDKANRFISSLEKRGFTADYFRDGTLCCLARLVNLVVEVYPMQHISEGESQVWIKSADGKPDSYSIRVIEKDQDNFESYLEIDDIPQRHIDKVIKAACKRFNCPSIYFDV